MTGLMRSILMGALAMAASGCEARRCLWSESGLIMPREEAVIAGASHGMAGRAIMEAAWAGDRATMDRMLAEDPRLVTTGSPGERGADLLIVALLHCDREMLDLLLAAGALPEGSGERWPLAYAIAAPHRDLVEPLLKAGAPVHANAARFRDPMDMAILYSRPDVIRLLVQHGVDVNAYTVTGGTALWSALAVEKFDLAEMLIDMGANIWWMDGAGGTYGWALNRTSLKNDPAQEAIRARLIARFKAAGYPWSPPDPVEGRRMLEQGGWPPPGSNAPPLPQAILDQAARHREARREWNLGP